MCKPLKRNTISLQGCSATFVLNSKRSRRQVAIVFSCFVRRQIQKVERGAMAKLGFTSLYWGFCYKGSEEEAPLKLKAFWQSFAVFSLKYIVLPNIFITFTYFKKCGHIGPAYDWKGEGGGAWSDPPPPGCASCLTGTCISFLFYFTLIHMR